MGNRVASRFSISFLPSALEDLTTLEKEGVHLSLSTLLEKQSAGEDFRVIGKPLKGLVPNLFRLRVRAYHILYEVKDQRILVVALRKALEGNVFKRVHFLKAPLS
jgi:mRNA-degrading endonuclease RelE of RelBE toxin-antitoxin system